MKLPDFTLDKALNQLRIKMGGIGLGSFSSSANPRSGLTPEQVEQLAREGIEIPLDEVEVLADGTLAYKGMRVVLYIRDVKQYRQAAPSLPRFHVSDCDTLHEMRAKNRFGRYVVATRDSGTFQIRMMTFNSNKFTTSEEELNVCQNCLAEIDWNSFARYRHTSAKKRSQIVSSFSLKAYFEKFGKTFISNIPLHTEETAPENDYTDDWSIVAKQIKQKRNFRCDNCGIDLSKWRKFLHAHHKNGLQYDNVESNIAILCVEHHATEPSHGHMKGADYYEFLRLKKSGVIK